MTDARTAPEKGLALQLKARLLGISPMIWRRVLVPETMSLHELHGVLQVAVGREGIHLFQFNIRGVMPADALVKGRRHLMLQTGTRVLDGTLRTRFQSWYPWLFNAANTNQDMKNAAA